MKGALLFNLSVIIQTLSYVFGKFIYLRPMNIVPMQLLFLRGVVSLAGMMIWFNTGFMEVSWYGIPEGSLFSLVLRGFTATLAVMIQFSVIKYLNLVIVGVASNAIPPITAFMSFLLIGEVLKQRHIFQIILTFIGVTMITMGYEEEEHADEHRQIAIIGCVFLPFIVSLQNILMSTMKGINEWTVSIYISIVLSIVLGIVMLYQDPS